MVSVSRFGLLLLILVALSGSINAEIPRIISYQGKVTDSGGNPVADGSYDMQFRLFNAAAAGDQRWESGTVSVQVTGGVFSVLLGESPQPLIILHFDEDLWLQVTFDGVVQTPRQRLSSVGYAYMASGLVPGTEIEEAMYGGVLNIRNQETSGVADGIYVRTNSTGGYAVQGIAEATSGLTRGVYGRAYSANGRAVIGYNSAATGDAYGVYGETASIAGMAVSGWAWASTGVTCGGYFETASTSGSGVRGVATATTGVTYGVYGRSYSTTASSRGVYGRSYATTSETYGVIGQSDSHLGMGVYGSAPSYGVYGVADRSTFAHAVQGVTTSTVGVGVYGSASAASGDTYGVYGRSVSPDGIGLRGIHETSSGAGVGVAGRTNSPAGFGVVGEGLATTGSSIGVYGYSNADDGIAVWAEASSGSNGTGITARGDLQGGIFHDVSSGNWAACGRGSYKILGSGSVDFVQNHPYNGDEVIVYA
ncbi:hypothetical protein JXA88_05420, partial [Candidatus Fermentibacteria bacterium]|nr:hypothetical protein [Candidatus Fermentibacteria bacterium]